MGTNIYARRIPKIDDKMSIIIDIINDDYAKAKEKLQSFCKVIHIGKRSAGWKFIFNHNNWQYYNNVAEMKDWLRNYQIETEYGEVLTCEEFWEDVEIRQKTQKYRNEKFNSSCYIVKDGYEFSTSTEFS